MALRLRRSPMMIAFDLHIHTRRYSGCSFIEYEDLVGQAASAGLSGFALTEHGMRWPDAEFGRLRDIAAERGMLLINGQEINTFDASHRSEGEFLVFGLSRSLTKECPAAELVHTVHEEGGIVIAAHPYKLARGGKSHYYGAGDRVYQLKLDAIELCHPDHGESAMKKVRRAMEELKIPGTGGSDAHKILQVGSCVTVFENPVRNEDDFIREIRAGRIRAEKRSPEA
ncbi:MAG: PHP domain-containing protein [Syntrophaceae bacterium]|nr:PHP domain-containing protein [Syntrophaceae bacterium]MBP9532775.1 PHP domain-containing protein [Syntrophaceae bacterium]